VILLGVFLGSYFIFRSEIFIIFSIIFGTWFYYSFLKFLIGSIPNSADFYKYSTLVIGVVYVLLGYFFSKRSWRSLSGVLYTFGSLAFLGAVFALSGWKPNQSVLWELLLPILIFGVLSLSVFLKSKSFLTFGTLYLMAYIIKITTEYFTEGLGWPLALVIAGLALIATGWFAIRLNIKYIKNPGISVLNS